MIQVSCVTVKIISTWSYIKAVWKSQVDPHSGFCSFVH
jgi:hypothetical protein